MADKDTPCHHCGLAVGTHPVGSDPWFCCTGCQTVYYVLQNSGLADTYYRLQDATAGRSPSRPAVTDRNPLLLAELDTEGFLEDHTTELDGGTRRVRLYVNGVHCAGCVWLIERLPAEVAGVESARVDLPRSRLTLEWKPDQVKLSNIGEWLARFGYAVQPRVRDDAEGAVREERELLTRVGASWALAGNIMLIAFALYAGLDDSFEANLNTAARWASFLLAIPAVTYGAAPFFQRAWASLRHALARRSFLHLHMDTPISIGIAVGFTHSAWATVSGSGDIWFDSIAVLIAALQTARWIQFRSKRMAGDAADRLLALIPTMARKVTGEQRIETVPAASLEEGDLVEVPAGEVIPVDGDIAMGQSHVDNAVLTGESVPSRVEEGSRVWAGATNMSARIVVTVIASGTSTKVGQLLSWVQEDQSARAPVTMLADRLSGFFVASVLLLAALTALTWLQVRPEAVVANVVALLVITCPCALGMATPLAMAVGIGKAARQGIFIKNEAAIQSLTEIQTVVLDKTGTLTYGRMSVVEVFGDKSAVQLAAAVEEQSNHPIASAIVEYAADRDPSATHGLAEGVATRAGEGISGIVNRRQVDVGKLEWIGKVAAVSSQFESAEHDFADRGATPIAIAVDGKVTTMLAVADEIRPDAFRLVSYLKQEEIVPLICSGDHPATVRHAAAQLGIPKRQTYARCEPERKRDIVSGLVAEHQRVAMIGDGVNDAGALRQADVGVAVSGSSMAGQVSSDVFLTGRGVDSVSQLFRGARHVMRVIRGNLAFSLMYNLVGAAAAMAGLVTPLVAAVAMPVSSLVVVVLSSVQKPFS